MMISNNKLQFRNVTARNQPLCHDTERCYCQDTIQHLKVFYANKDKLFSININKANFFKIRRKTKRDSPIPLSKWFTVIMMSTMRSILNDVP